MTENVSKNNVGSVPKGQAKILIVVPAFNEERSIAYVVQKIKSLHPEVDIVVVSDGSTDRTVEVAESAGARVVSLPYNLGIGGAVQTGFKVAESEGYDIAVQIDGDAQHDPVYLTPLLEPILAGRLDMCVGSRFLSESSAFKSTFMRRIGINMFSYLLQALIHIKMSDPTSGFRAINRKLIKEFGRSYPIDFPEPEAIKLAQRYGARIGEISVNMQKRLGGQSSIRYFATLYYMVKVTLAILIDTLRKRK